MSYWYCLKHKTVEPDEGCRNADRLGPYETEAEAANALAKVEERNEAWDKADEKWGEAAGGFPTESPRVQRAAAAGRAPGGPAAGAPPPPPPAGDQRGLTRSSTSAPLPLSVVTSRSPFGAGTVVRIRP